jgi:hypothetical protein
MSHVTDQYIESVRHVSEEQYTCLRSVMERLCTSRCVVQQVSFIEGARSLNEEDPRKNLPVFNVPKTDIDEIRLKLSKIHRGRFQSGHFDSRPVDPPKRPNPPYLVPSSPVDPPKRPNPPYLAPSRTVVLTKSGNAKSGKEKERV